MHLDGAYVRELGWESQDIHTLLRESTVAFHLLERFEVRCADCILEPFRERHSQFVESAHERIRQTRRRLASHHRVKKIEKKTKEKLDQLTEKLK